MAPRLRASAAGRGRAWSCRSRSRRPRPPCGLRARVRLTPSTALMWPDRAPEQPALDGEPHADVARRHHDGRVLGAGGRAAARLRLEEPARVGVARARRRPSGDRPGLDDLALRHHADAVRHLAHDAEVVGDEQHAPCRSARAGRGGVQDLGLDGDVERGGGLVGDQQVGLVGERHGDHHALALAARELVRVGARGAARPRGRPTSRSSSSVRAPCARAAQPACGPAAPRSPAARWCGAGSATSSAPGRSSRCGCRGPRAGVAPARPAAPRPRKRMLPRGWRAGG